MVLVEVLTGGNLWDGDVPWLGLQKEAMHLQRNTVGLHRLAEHRPAAMCFRRPKGPRACLERGIIPHNCCPARREGSTWAATIAWKHVWHMPQQQRLHSGMVDATEVRDIGLGQREELQGLDAQSLRDSGLGLQQRCKLHADSKVRLRVTLDVSFHRHVDVVFR